MGAAQPELRITKAGHENLHWLLVGVAHHILVPFGPDTDLQRWGLKLAGWVPHDVAPSAAASV
ncbi:MAG: hypothetical protein ACLQUT_01555 [Thermoleophilia bacterium]